MDSLWPLTNSSQAHYTDNVTYRIAMLKKQLFDHDRVLFHIVDPRIGLCYIASKVVKLEFINWQFVVNDAYLKHANRVMH